MEKNNTENELIENEETVEDKEVENVNDDSEDSLESVENNIDEKQESEEEFIPINSQTEFNKRIKGRVEKLKKDKLEYKEKYDTVSETIKSYEEKISKVDSLTNSLGALNAENLRLKTVIEVSGKTGVSVGDFPEYLTKPDEIEDYANRLLKAFQSNHSVKPGYPGQGGKPSVEKKDYFQEFLKR